MSRREHAIVIGGSVAGMLAARVLSDHFARVTVLDRDHLPDSPEPRKGVPQSEHVHVLLRRGLLIMEQLFPDLDDDLKQAGALSVDWTADLVTFTPAGWSPRFPSNYITRTCSRGLLENLIRRRTMTIRNITITPRCEAIDLAANDNKTVVTGVKVRYRDQAGNNLATLEGDLVMDASGRSSRSSDWLSALGYAAPEETVVNAFIGYATRVYRRPPNFNADWKAMIVRTRPPFGLRGGTIYPIENDQWMVLLGGAGEERPPTDEASFLPFTKTFIHPAIHEALTSAEPLSSVYAYQRTENRWRRFERFARWPEHFIILGDAVCALNPIYGQGMSVAAMESQALDIWLRASQSSLAFQKQLLDVVRTPWLMATNEDLRLPGVVGVQPGRIDRWMQRYIDQVLWLSSSDPFTFETFMGVSQLVKPPSALFQPRIALKVLRRVLHNEQPRGKPTDQIPQDPNSSHRQA